MSRSQLGEWGESVARRHIEAKGYAVIAVNWRCREGEIDLVARDRSTLVFVEVKTRTSDRFGPPEEAVTAPKLDRMQRAAAAYLATFGSPDIDWRIDVVAIDCSPGRKVLRLEHLVDVVTRSNPLGEP